MENFVNVILSEMVATTTPLSANPRRSCLKIIAALILFFSATAFARVGDTLEELKARYAEPVGVKENSALKTVAFKSSSGTFVILSSFKTKEDKVFGEAISLPVDVPPEVVVQKVAGAAQIAMFPQKTTNSLIESGIIPPTIAALWTINDGPIFAAYEPDSNSGGTVFFVVAITQFQVYFKALASNKVEGL